MSDTPETQEAWHAVSRTPDGMYDSRVPIMAYAQAMSEHSKKMERQRDAYAETLREIAQLSIWLSDVPLGDTIRERHPELAENA